VVAVGPKVITGVYHVPALHLRGTAVMTNTNMVGAYRGAGRPEAIYLVERLMDQAAAEIENGSRGIAPAQFHPALADAVQDADGREIRQRQLPAHARPHSSAGDWKGYAARRDESRKRGKLRGRALSTFLEWTGVVHEETVNLHVEADGRVLVFTRVAGNGQGIETSYVQILAETLDIDPDKIVIVQGDSDIAQGVGSMGSRSLYIGGSAMLTASKQTSRKARELAATRSKRQGRTSNIEMGVSKWPGRTSASDVRTRREATGKAHRDYDLAKSGRGRRGRTAAMSAKWRSIRTPVSPRSCAIRPWTTVGRVINPMIVAGQVHGGIAQAVGQALMENTHYDPETGQLITGSLQDYCLPSRGRSAELRYEHGRDHAVQDHPLGAKGVGELGTVGGTPTVMNAVIDALRHLGGQADRNARHRGKGLARNQPG